MAANAAIADSSKTNRYLIDIAPGTYYTYDENETYYKDTGAGWVVKPYVTLKGQDRESCIIAGELPDDYAGTAEGRNKITLYSTINLYDSAKLENLTITARNMRYPIHDEGGGNNKDQIHIIKNCHVEHIGNNGAIQYYKDNNCGTDIYEVWHWTTAYGYGASSGLLSVFEDSTFKSDTRAWYVHSNASFEKPQINILNNCHLSAGNTNDITVESLGSLNNDEVIFNDCTFDGLYIAYNDSPFIYSGKNDQPANHAEYNMIFNNCDSIGFNNGHRAAALAMFSKNTETGSSVNVSGTAAHTLFGNAVSNKGGGGLAGYVYGEWDISGILVGYSSNVTVNNTIGRRLGDLSSKSKTLEVIFDGDNTKKATITFNKDYTNMSNADILSEINSKISAYGTAVEYNVSLNEFYPVFTDKEVLVTNNGENGIPRFAAVCLDNGVYRRMTANDSIDKLVGIALERIIPGESGRVLKEGYFNKVQIGVKGSKIRDYVSLKSDGTFEINGTGTKIMEYNVSENWAYLNAR